MPSPEAMKILISGAGIAGLTLSFWLRLDGHDLTVVEKAPSLRDEGHMIDFFGSGYDVSELKKNNKRFRQ
jgi:2-polyprenyl-6-methoxyphenol hydroxylase-like FAD-dependent oxidoreductase